MLPSRKIKVKKDKGMKLRIRKFCIDFHGSDENILLVISVTQKILVRTLCPEWQYNCRLVGTADK